MRSIQHLVRVRHCCCERRTRRRCVVPRTTTDTVFQLIWIRRTADRALERRHCQRAQAGSMRRQGHGPAELLFQAFGATRCGPEIVMLRTHLIVWTQHRAACDLLSAERCATDLLHLAATASLDAQGSFIFRSPAVDRGAEGRVREARTCSQPESGQYRRRLYRYPFQVSPAAAITAARKTRPRADIILWATSTEPRPPRPPDLTAGAQTVTRLESTQGAYRTIGASVPGRAWPRARLERPRRRGVYRRSLESATSPARARGGSVWNVPRVGQSLCQVAERSLCVAGDGCCNARGDADEREAPSSTTAGSVHQCRADRRSSRSRLLERVGRPEGEAQRAASEVVDVSRRDVNTLAWVTVVVMWSTWAPDRRARWNSGPTGSRCHRQRDSHRGRERCERAVA